MNITQLLDQALEALRQDRKSGRLENDAIKTGLQFVEVQNIEKLFESLALRAAATSINNYIEGSAVRNVCMEQYNKYLSVTPGQKVRNVPHWKPDEVEEAVEWCKLNSSETGYAMNEMPDWIGWNDEISGEHLTIAEIVELAGVIDAAMTSKRMAVSEYLLMLSEKKFKQACEKPDEDDKTSG